ncbi:MAG: ATP-binding protein [Candidatus Aenigmarchaeota archaeon]|nr:ATP-binding protein [Candidatus Aenigmarchaeota archaeon]
MYVPRDTAGRFKKLSEAYGIIAVVGARQAGKTTFLKEHAKKIRSSYMLFDDPDVKEMFNEDIKKFEKHYIEGYDVAVLDEVQYCRDAGTKLKYLVDSGHRLWITSSTEVILAKDILSYLVGRVSVLRMFPFSLSEFFRAKSVEPDASAKIRKRSIWEHILYGGYPKVVTTEDTETKKIILKDLYETMILKDIARTFSIDDIDSLEKFTRYLSVSIGGIISYGTITSHLGISFQTIKKYMAAMEKSYLIKLIPPFFSNKSKEITKQPKMYFIDTGLRNAVREEFPANPDGRLFENYVLSELLKAGFSPKYWRTKSKSEVDFIIEKDGKITPIEVKLNSAGKIEKGMRSFMDAYRPKKAFIVSYDGALSKSTVNGCEIVFTDVAGLLESISSS